MSESRRLVKLKDKKKEIFPFMLLSFGLCHRRISVLAGLHKAVASFNYSISSRSRVHTLDDAPCIPSQTPAILLLSTILLAYLTSKPLFFKRFFTVSIRLLHVLPTTSTHSYIETFSNPVVLHPLHVAEPSENTTINLSAYTYCLPAQLPYLCIRYLSILLIP